MSDLVEILGNVALFGTPWLFVKAGLRFIEEHGIDTEKNRDHVWKVPPAELVLLASAVIGWVAILALVGAFGHATGMTGTPMGALEVDVIKPTVVWWVSS